MLNGKFGFLGILKKHSLFLTSSEDWNGGEDEAIRSGGTESDDTETASDDAEAAENTGSETTSDEAIGTSSDTETGDEETKGQ